MKILTIFFVIFAAMAVIMMSQPSESKLVIDSTGKQVPNPMLANGGSVKRKHMPIHEKRNFRHQ